MYWCLFGAASFWKLPLSMDQPQTPALTEKQSAQEEGAAHVLDLSGERLLLRFARSSTSSQKELHWSCQG